MHGAKSAPTEFAYIITGSNVHLARALPHARKVTRLGYPGFITRPLNASSIAPDSAGLCRSRRSRCGHPLFRIECTRCGQRDPGDGPKRRFLERCSGPDSLRRYRRQRHHGQGRNRHRCAAARSVHLDRSGSELRRADTRCHGTFCVGDYRAACVRVGDGPDRRFSRQRLCALRIECGIEDQRAPDRSSAVHLDREPTGARGAKRDHGERSSPLHAGYPGR